MAGFIYRATLLQGPCLLDRDVRLMSCDDIVRKMKKKNHIFLCVGLMKNFKISHNVRNTRENFKRGHSDTDIYKLTSSQSSLNLSYNEFFAGAMSIYVISTLTIETYG
jgi:hypothetical protein